MGAAASLVSKDQQASLRIAVHEALPFNMYPLEERRFVAGSLYESSRFSAHRSHQQLFEVLGLHEWSVSQIWRHFNLMNTTGSGEVNLWEFREYFDFPDDRSTTRLFRCFDEDRNNRISFLELVVGLWTYCCQCNAALVCLFFDFFDTDHNGEISLEEADHMIEDVFGTHWESNAEGKVAHDWLHGRRDAQLGSPELGIDDWAAFMSANLSAVGGVFRVRRVMQRKLNAHVPAARLDDAKVIGVGFWTHCVRKRVQIYANRRVTVEQLLGAHISREILDSLARDRNPTEDHTAATQFALKVLRRTGPFPNRRKYRELKGKAIALGGVDAKFKALTVRETFQRLKVPPGQDPGWEEPKPPSTTQALLAALRPAVDQRGGDAAQAIAATDGLHSAEKHVFKQIKRARSPPVDERPAEALTLLTVRPGLGNVLPSSAASGDGIGGITAGSKRAEDDPIIANAFHGLQTPPERPQSAKSRGERKIERGRTKSNERDGAGRPLSANSVLYTSSRVGGGKEELSRVGKQLVSAGAILSAGSRG